MQTLNKNKLKSSINIGKKTYHYYDLNKLKGQGLKDPKGLPFSIKILLESALRNYDNYQVTLKDIRNILSWSPKLTTQKEIAFKPGRVLLQDFTGVPCVVDLAAMRQAVKNLGGDVKKINPQVPCDLIIDHSLQVDCFGTKTAFSKNIAIEFKRNKERYKFLKWGQQAFRNFRVIPPATGIIHQINLEYIAQGLLKNKECNQTVVYPDSLVGTDSHTTMINGIGIVGWGVGGIEAEAVMLGEPIYMLLPEVVGFKLKGKLSDGVTATDLVLTVVEMLRKKGVVGKFVEFTGPALKNLSLPDRAVISNMGPEYGATLGIFPVDEQTIDYYRLTGRNADQVKLIEAYAKKQGLFYDEKTYRPKYSDTLELDISTVKPSLAGPKRPQDRIERTALKTSFEQTFKPKGACAPGKLQDGSVVIASITSCTNTSNPSLVMAAGLLAKKAADKGLKVKDFVKTSFAPGSQVIEEYLRKAGLLPSLEKLKFHIVGYGCATCIGNSGPLADSIVKEIQQKKLNVTSVTSGNRNFEGRISPHTKGNYLTSPPLVVAYALAGNVRTDWDKDPIGKDKKGEPVYLKDIWPSAAEIQQYVSKFVSAKAYKDCYKNITQGNALWQNINAKDSVLFPWDAKSTYIQYPPFFEGMSRETGAIQPVTNARVLVKVGDSITTDHISPAGNIAKDSPAGKYLIAQKVAQKDFNSYGSRRGNDRVMTRGTFANIRLKNQTAPGTEGSWTTYFPKKKRMSIYDAAIAYKKDGTPLVVLAGKEYGTGSSRDWAAKGTALLGVKVVLAESFERIHRSNLAGMGILPLQFKEGESADSLGLTGEEIFNFEGIADGMKPRAEITVKAASANGKTKTFKAILRLDTPVEIGYFRNGGILQTVIRKLVLR